MNDANCPTATSRSSWSGSPRPPPSPASRWMGRGDKEGADGAAVDAMRHVLNSVPMDGVVVIGEGEKDEAPMLFNGEEIGDGSPPQTDIAVDPIDGTTLTGARSGQRPRRDRRVRAGHDVRPGPVRLHGEDRRRPRGQGPGVPRAVGHREPAGCAPRPRASPSARSPPWSSTATATTSSWPRSEGPGPASASSRTATWPGPSPRPGPTPAPTSCSASAAPPRGSSPRPPSSAWGASSRAASGPATTTSARRPSTPATTSTASCRIDDMVAGRQLLLRRHRHHRRRAAQGRALPGDSVFTESLVMRSKSGTVRVVNGRHKAAKLKEYTALGS